MKVEISLTFSYAKQYSLYPGYFEYYEIMISWINPIEESYSRCYHFCLSRQSTWLWSGSKFHSTFCDCSFNVSSIVSLCSYSDLCVCHPVASLGLGWWSLSGFFWLLPEASGILVPWPGIEPMFPPLEMQSLNHWTLRKVPLSSPWYNVQNQIHAWLAWK